MLIVCPLLSISTVRERLKTDVKNLCQVEAHGPLSPKPPKFSESEMWAVMMLCTKAASHPPQPLHGRSGKARIADAYCFIGGESERERYVLCLLYIIGME